LSLGISFIHETGHALDIYSGNIYKYDGIKNKDLKTAVIGYRIYDYELKYAPASYNKSGIRFLNANFKIIAGFGYNPDNFLNW